MFRLPGPVTSRRSHTNPFCILTVVTSKCKACDSTFSYEYAGGPYRKYCDEHREGDTPVRRRSYYLKRMYGLTEVVYDQLLERQGHRCAICQTEDPRHYGKFNIDHCHESGKVRGLLCAQCNQALGKFQDNISNLERAILYLREHSE